MVLHKYWFGIDSIELYWQYIEIGIDYVYVCWLYYWWLPAAAHEQNWYIFITYIYKIYFVIFDQENEIKWTQ